MTPLPPSQLAPHDIPTFSMPTSKPICTLHHQLIGITADAAVDHDDNNFQNRLHWCPGAKPTSHRLEAYHIYWKFISSRTLYSTRNMCERME